MLGAAVPLSLAAGGALAADGDGDVLLLEHAPTSIMTTTARADVVRSLLAIESPPPANYHRLWVTSGSAGSAT